MNETDDTKFKTELEELLALPGVSVLEGCVRLSLKADKWIYLDALQLSSNPTEFFKKAHDLLLVELAELFRERENTLNALGRKYHPKDN